MVTSEENLMNARRVLPHGNVRSMYKVSCWSSLLDEQLGVM